MTQIKQGLKETICTTWHVLQTVKLSHVSIEGWILLLIHPPLRFQFVINSQEKLKNSTLHDALLNMFGQPKGQWSDK